MMRHSIRLGIVTAAGCLWAAIGCAHHSFAMFDRSRSVTISGTIKKVEWTNPHIWFWISVAKESGGGSDDWALEAGEPANMNRLGMRRTLFKPGEKITVDVYPMKDGRLGGQFVRATLADGTKIDIVKSYEKFSSGG